MVYLLFVVVSIIGH